MILRGTICFIAFLVISSVCADKQAKLTHIDLRTKLLKDVFVNYTTGVRPVEDDSQPVNLRFGIYLRSLDWLSTSWDKKSVSFYLFKDWFDPRLKWNISQYGNLFYLRVDPGKVWKPDLTVVNSFGGGVKRSGKVYISSNGHLYWYPEVSYMAHCGMDVSRFPFDVQTCVVTFAAWTHSTINITLYHGTRLDTTYYVVNKQWILLGGNITKRKKVFACCPDIHYQFIDVTLRWKRHSTMPQHLLILPAVLIAISCPFVFLLPPNSNHKITLGIITILCMLLLEWVLMAWMPRAATTVPYIAKYFFLTLAMSVISLIVSTIVVGMSDRGPRTNRVPVFLRTWMLQGLKKLVFLGDVDYTHLDSKQMSMHGLENPMSDGEKALTKLDRDTDFIGKQVKMLVTRASGLELQSDIQNEWRLLAMVIDRLMFFIYTFIFAVAALAIYS